MINTQTDGLSINFRPDITARGLSNDSLALLESGDGCDMQLEPVTLEELEHTYLYNGLVQDSMLLAAVTSVTSRLPKTMSAIMRKLNQKLTGTGIKAGVKTEFYDDGGMSQELAGALISKPRSLGLFSVITAQIPCSDGQSISLVFHAPDEDPKKITPDDKLIAFRFLLNKRDITHIVAPSNGKDISLDQTVMSLSNALEKNSKKFQANIQKSMADRKELADKQDEYERVTDELAQVNAQIESVDSVNSTLTERKAELETKLSEREKKANLLKVKIDDWKPAEPPAQPNSNKPLVVGDSFTVEGDSYTIESIDTANRSIMASGVGMSASELDEIGVVVLGVNDAATKARFDDEAKNKADANKAKLSAFEAQINAVTKEQLAILAGFSELRSKGDTHSLYSNPGDGSHLSAEFNMVTKGIYHFEFGTALDTPYVFEGDLKGAKDKLNRIAVINLISQGYGDVFNAEKAVSSDEELRMAAIEDLAKFISHTGGKSWLENSDLSIDEIKELKEKFSDDRYPLFSMVNDFSPRQALEISPITASVFARYLAETSKPDLVMQVSDADMAMIWEKLKVSNGNRPSDTSSGDALVVAKYGDAAERKHAATFPTRKFSHPSYAGAVEKLKEMAKPYLERIGAGSSKGKEAEYDPNNEYDPQNSIAGIKQFAKQYGVTVSDIDMTADDFEGEYDTIRVTLKANENTAYMQIANDGKMAMFDENGKRVSGWGQYTFFQNYSNDDDTLETRIKLFAVFSGTYELPQSDTHASLQREITEVIEANLPELVALVDEYEKSGKTIERPVSPEGFIRELRRLGNRLDALGLDYVEPSVKTFADDVNYVVQSLFADTMLNALQNAGLAPLNPQKPNESESSKVQEFIDSLKPQVSEIGDDLRGRYDAYGAIADVHKIFKKALVEVAQSITDSFKEADENPYVVALNTAANASNVVEAYNSLLETWLQGEEPLPPVTAAERDFMDKLDDVQEMVFEWVKDAKKNVRQDGPLNAVLSDRVRQQVVAQVNILLNAMTSANIAENAKVDAMLSAHRAQTFIDEMREAGWEMAQEVSEEKELAQLEELKKIIDGEFDIEPAIDTVNRVNDFLDEHELYEKHSAELAQANHAIADAMAARLNKYEEDK